MSSISYFLHTISTLPKLTELRILLLPTFHMYHKFTSLVILHWGMVHETAASYCFRPLLLSTRRLKLPLSNRNRILFVFSQSGHSRRNRDYYLSSLSLQRARDFTHTRKQKNLLPSVSSIPTLNWVQVWRNNFRKVSLCIGCSTSTLHHYHTKHSCSHQTNPR